MADGSTPNYAFVLPEVGFSKDAWGTKLNQNWTDLDLDLLTFLSLDGARTMTGNVIIAKTGDVMMQMKNTSGAFAFTNIQVDDLTGSLSVTHPTSALIALTVDDRGTALAGAQSAVTQEKGDFRYLKLAGGTVVGAAIFQSTVNVEGILTAEAALNAEANVTVTGQKISVDRNGLNLVGYYDLRTDAGKEGAFRIYDNVGATYRKVMQLSTGGLFIIGNDTWAVAQSMVGAFTTTGIWTFNNSVLMGAADQFLADFGTVALPGISFNGDPNTGFYRVSDGRVAYSGNGVQRHVFEADGLLGATASVVTRANGDLRYLQLGGGTLTGTLITTAQILADFGIVSLPGYGFDGDPDTGFYRINSGQVGYTANGAQRYVFEANGELGNLNSIVRRSSGDARYSLIMQEVTASMASGETTIAHGLGSVPKDFQLYGKCTIAYDVFAIGDRIVIPNSYNASSTQFNADVRADPTNFKIRCAATIRICNAAGTGLETLNYANWDFLVSYR